MSQQINLKSFQLIVKNTKTYELIISGFTKTSLWFVNIFQSLVIVAVLNLRLKSTATINLDPLRMNLGTMSLTSKILATISNSVVFSTVASLTYKVASTISNSAVISYVMKLTNKVSSTLKTTQNIVLAMVTAVFNILGDFDGDTLGTMDVQTLGDLDYTVV